MAKKKTVKIVERKLGREKAYGQCFGDGLIELDPRMNSKQYLNVSIHELLHHIFTEMSETQVNKTASITSEELWNLGYRRIYK